MRILSKIIVAVLLNAAGLWILSYLVPEISFTSDVVIALEVALVLTALNFLIRPILKLLLGPIIVLTLGLGLLFLNGFMLKLLDILSKDLSIQGIPALIYATLGMSVVNIVFHLSTKSSS